MAIFKENQQNRITSCKKYIKVLFRMEDNLKPREKHALDLEQQCRRITLLVIFSDALNQIVLFKYTKRKITELKFLMDLSRDFPIISGT